MGCLRRRRIFGFEGRTLGEVRVMRLAELLERERHSCEYVLLQARSGWHEREAAGVRGKRGFRRKGRSLRLLAALFHVDT